jgi:hypothetical protein
MQCELMIANADLYSMPSMSDNNHLELPLHLPNCKRSDAQARKQKEIREMLISTSKILNKLMQQETCMLLQRWIM